MAAKFIILLATIALATAANVPPKEDANTLEEIQKHAGEFAKMFSEQISSLASSKNTEEFNKVLKKNSDDLLSKISEFSSSINKALEETNGKAKEAFSEASTKLQKTVEDLKKQNPQVEAQAKEIGDKIKSAVSNTVAETDKLAKTLAQQGQEISEKVAPTLKTSYDTFVKNVEDIQKKIHEAAQKENAKH